jgi:hypothetical protein
VNLTLRSLRVVDTVDRRILGAFRLVDSVTLTPVLVPVAIAVPGASRTGVPGEMRLDAQAVRIRQGRNGQFVIFSAPFFDAYTAAFLNPVPPPELGGGVLSLRVRVGPVSHYLPQEFQFDLPRRLDSEDPRASDSALVPQPVPLFRAPGAPLQDGWAVVRASVTERNTNPAVALPAVLVRVFRSPRAPDAQPIGEGMTDWRGNARGEALVAVTGLERFRAGGGQSVVETEHEVVFEAMRDSAFTGEAGQAPNVAAVRAVPPDAQLAVTRPTPPIRLRAGREHAVELTMR